MELAKKKIVVVGLARTGASVASFLAQRGAAVTITDMKDETAVAAYMEKLHGLEVRYELGGHSDRTFLSADLIVVSPGVPMDIAPIEAARTAGKVIVSEIELASTFIEAPVVAITGTNGKTTTTTLTGEIFEACGYKTFVGGNIGMPLIDLAASNETVDRVVAEISSFQLEAIRSFHPRVAVLLNITEDHLDRYACYRDYIDAKVRIFENQTGQDFAVLNVDDPIVASLQDKISARLFPMSQKKAVEQGIYCLDNCITFSWEGRQETFPTAGFKLKGVHNIENIMAALASTLLLGCSADAALSAVEGFSGLHHRMELVRELNGVRYYNDSKGTNVGSVVKSLESFPGNVTLIAGGKDKGGDYSPLSGLVRERVKHLILLGEARQRISDALGSLTDTRVVDTLEEAVTLASRVTLPGGIVLFSPACSSFDMFRNYEERGDRFADLVRDLPGGGA